MLGIKVLLKGVFSEKPFVENEEEDIQNVISKHLKDVNSELDIIKNNVFEGQSSISLESEEK